MIRKTLFVANSIVSIPFGIGCVVAPSPFISLFGATLGPAGALMMRYGGAWLIGLGLITWLTRNATDGAIGRAIAQALTAAYLVTLVVSVLGQFAGVLNLLGWMPVAIQLFFAAGFGLSVVTSPESIVPAQQPS
jgi:hypothetical protein